MSNDKRYFLGGMECSKAELMCISEGLNSDFGKILMRLCSALRDEATENVTIPQVEERAADFERGRRVAYLNLLQLGDAVSSELLEDAQDPRQ